MDAKILNFLGEFIDKSLEKEYFQQDMKKAMSYIKPVILLLGVLYTLFIIPDYLLIQDQRRFRAVLLCRILFIVLVVFLFLRLRYIKNYRLLSYWVTAYEIFAVLIFLFVFYQYETPDFLIQAFGVIIIILATFLVPNRWINMILVSIISITSFIGLSLYYLEDIKPSHLSAGIVYNLIVIVFSCVFSFRSQYYKRIHYVNNKELVRLSTTDPLTGAYNRAKFDDELDKCQAYSKRYQSPLSLIIFDFDDFKDINDTYGHLVGDQVIIETSAFIKETVRETDIFARWGGEEFVILLPNTELDAAVELAERLRQDIENLKFEKTNRITCSFGVVRLTAEDHAESFLDRADKLLYQAKNSGKNSVKVED